MVETGPCYSSGLRDPLEARRGTDVVRPILGSLVASNLVEDLQNSEKREKVSRYLNGGFIGWISKQEKEGNF